MRGTSAGAGIAVFFKVLVLLSIPARLKGNLIVFLAY
jgi:hypothetical protein